VYPFKLRPINYKEWRHPHEKKYHRDGKAVKRDILGIGGNGSAEGAGIHSGNSGERS
jgi:hypothetical protein